MIRAGTMELKMKATFPALACLLALTGCAQAPASPQAQSAVPACLRSDMLDHTTVPDNRTILFHMRSGEVWKNTLPAPCVGLDFPGGFSYATFHDEICANVEVIRILTDGNRCMLGAFSPAEPGK
jgi:hypothetical protein